MSSHRAIALLVALLASAALAQSRDESTDDSSTPLPPVDAPAPAEAALPDTGVAAKEPTALLTTVNARAKAGEAKELAELLVTVPGLHVQDGGGAGQRTQLVLRGASSTAVPVLLDGIPLGAPGTPIDLSRLGTAIVDELEVLRGPAAARFGPGALGGAINLRTRAPSAAPTLWGELTQGSFTTTRVQAGGAAHVGPGDALASAHFSRSAGDWPFLLDETPALGGDPLVERHRENNDALVAGGLARWRGRVMGLGLDVRAELSGGSRGLAGPAENPTPTTRQQFLRGSGVARALKTFQSGGTLEVTAFARGDRDTFKGAGFGPQLFRQTTGGAGGEVVYSHLLFGWHGLTALVSGGGDWLTSDSGSASWGHGSVMLTDEILLFQGRWTIAPSVRLDLSGPFFGFSPRLGTALLLPGGFEVRANAGQTHRPPSFSELYVQQGTFSPNPQLKPERALSLDGALGWKHQYAQVQVGGFWSLYEDLISYEYYPPLRARPYNFMTARVAGIEAEAALTPWPWLSASGSYTFLSTQNLKDDERYYLKPLPYRPAHKISGRVDAGPRWLKLHGEVLFQSEQAINRSNVVQLPARAIFNAGASARPLEHPDIRLSLELKNLTDVQAQDLDGYPLPPRAAYLTLAVAWDSALSQPEN